MISGINWIKFTFSDLSRLWAVYENDSGLSIPNFSRNNRKCRVLSVSVKRWSFSSSHWCSKINESPYNQIDFYYLIFLFISIFFSPKENWYYVVNFCIPEDAIHVNFPLPLRTYWMYRELFFVAFVSLKINTWQRINQNSIRNCIPNSLLFLR